MQDDEIIGRLPTIPEYYRLYINKYVDLLSEPKQCCPFHKENTPSFSYSLEKKKWRCFGGCKVGGGVLELHQKNYNLSSRDEAERSLKALHKVVDKIELRKPAVNRLVNEDKVYSETIYQKGLMLAKTVEHWLEFDYLMSKTPVDISALSLAIEKWGV